MELVTAEQRRRMEENWRVSRSDTEKDHGHKPVVKLFNPCGAATWLLSETDPDHPDTAFGLCDLGMGEPELGYVDLAELRALVLPFGLKIERDLFFEPGASLTEYADEARKTGRIAA